MVLLSWLFFLAAGKILIQVWMLFHFPRFLKKYEWLNELHKCDLCSGCYIYSILSFFMETDLLDATGFGYIPIVGAVVTGIIVSWIVHIFTLGWKAKYEIVVV